MSRFLRFNSFINENLSKDDFEDYIPKLMHMMENAFKQIAKNVNEDELDLNLEGYLFPDVHSENTIIDNIHSEFGNKLSANDCDNLAEMFQAYLKKKYGKNVISTFRKQFKI